MLCLGYIFDDYKVMLSKQLDGYMSLKTEGDEAKDQNLGVIKLKMIFKAVRMGDITKYSQKKKVTRIKPWDILIGTSVKDEQIPEEETESSR